MKKISVLILTLCSVTSFAQQEAQFSQNMFTKLTVNPAYAGIRHSYCATLLYRSQWVGFPGAPKTASLNFDAYLENINSGVGLTVVSDRLGFDKSMLVRGAYSFHWEFSNENILAFGAELGFMQKSLNGAWLPPQTINDDAIPKPSISATAFDAGAGAYYKGQQTYFGLSVTQLPQSTFTRGTVDFKSVRHYYLTAGWNRQLNADILLTPSVFVKTDAVSMQLDVNLMAEFNNRFWGGASYRLTDAFVLMGGVKRGNWKFGYAYDITASRLRYHSSNTHELMVGYCHPIVSLPTIWDNVRYAN
jgi:type IX secretion system PorP/SprF family membrane protein